MDFSQLSEKYVIHIHLKTRRHTRHAHTAAQIVSETNSSEEHSTYSAYDHNLTKTAQWEGLKVRKASWWWSLFLDRQSGKHTVEQLSITAQLSDNWFMCDYIILISGTYIKLNLATIMGWKEAWQQYERFLVFRHNNVQHFGWTAMKFCRYWRTDFSSSTTMRLTLVVLRFIGWIAMTFGRHSCSPRDEP